MEIPLTYESYGGSCIIEWYQRIFQTLGLNGSQRQLDYLKKIPFILPKCILKMMGDVMNNNSFFFNMWDILKKEIRVEWCNVAWMTPHIS